MGALHKLTHEPLPLTPAPLPAGWATRRAPWKRRALREVRGGRTRRRSALRKMASEKARNFSKYILGDAVLFSAVKIPCQAEKMYISILKKRIIPDIF